MLCGRRTWGCEHPFASEDGVRAGQEAHGLLRLGIDVATSSQADDCLGKRYPRRRDRPQHRLVAHGLIVIGGSAIIRH